MHELVVMALDAVNETNGFPVAVHDNHIPIMPLLLCLE
ncbi:hypothetical protein SAMN00790413_04629 [Deinococcus hopiensis KR-140]|uniref:Uncharacterized protein n=1 Tax=Deinococcus hopiensis KR-140 TaxID=695939 RepID=A0A1W1UKH5_9DEIO|nr:hypothetical protein SAMN00790413_04629 [Deinococcus hopiensis KR-140]